MIVISQNEEKITDNISFSIQERITCKNIIIDEKSWKKFKKITNKQDDYMNLQELKGLGELLEQNITKSVFLIRQSSNNDIFGIYNTRSKAKEVIKEIIGTYERSDAKSYYIPKNSKGVIVHG